MSANCNTNFHMADYTPHCTEGRLYSDLPSSTASLGNEVGMSVSLQKNVVQSFLRRHLPAGRLLANQDNIGLSTVPLSIPIRKKFNKSRRKKKKLTNKERIETKAFTIPKKKQRYEDQLVLHKAWQQYMEELIPSNSLTSSGAEQAACQKLLKAELAGSIITVIRSKCPSYVGLRGVVMQESRHMFTLITPQDAVKCVPKANSIFALDLHGYIFTIHGNHFMVKAGERSSRKFKSKPTTDL